MARPCAGSWGRRKQQPHSLQCFAALALIAALHAATVLAQAPIANQGWGVALDGSTTSAVVTPSLSFNKTFTVEGWFYMTRAPVACSGSETDSCTEFFFLSGSYNGRTYSWRASLFFDGFRNQIWVPADPLQTGWGYAASITAANWPLNTWMHIAVGHDGSGQFPVWINGTYVAGGGGMSFGPDGFANLNAGLVVGGGAGSANSFQGRIDEVRVWNRLRTDAEIAASLYGNVPTTAAGLIAYYTFDEGRPVSKMQDYARKTGDLTLPAGAAMYYPGAPDVGSFAGFNAFAEISGTSSITVDGARVCLGPCP